MRIILFLSFFDRVRKLMKCRYYTDPSGTFWQCNAKAIGSGSEGADSSLQEQYNKVYFVCVAQALCNTSISSSVNFFLIFATVNLKN